MAFKDVHRQPVLLLRLISFNRTLLGLLGRPNVRGLGCWRNGRRNVCLQPPNNLECQGRLGGCVASLPDCGHCLWPTLLCHTPAEHQPAPVTAGTVPGPRRISYRNCSEPLCEQGLRARWISTATTEATFRDNGIAFALFQHSNSWIRFLLLKVRQPRLINNKRTL